jgi:hypothetical protein
MPAHTRTSDEPSVWCVLLRAVVAVQLVVIWTIYSVTCAVQGAPKYVDDEFCNLVLVIAAGVISPFPLIIVEFMVGGAVFGACLIFPWDVRWVREGLRRRRAAREDIELADY